METMLAAVERLRLAGFEIDHTAEPGARLRCGRCGESTPASRALVRETVRFEGLSDPDDEQILVALTTSCGHQGRFQTLYGPAIGAENAEVLQSLGGR